MENPLTDARQESRAQPVGRKLVTMWRDGVSWRKMCSTSRILERLTKVIEEFEKRHVLQLLFGRQRLGVQR